MGNVTAHLAEQRIARVLLTGRRLTLDEIAAEARAPRPMTRRTLNDLVRTRMAVEIVPPTQDETSRAIAAARPVFGLVDKEEDIRPHARELLRLFVPPAEPTMMIRGSVINSAFLAAGVGGGPDPTLIHRRKPPGYKSADGQRGLDIGLNPTGLAMMEIYMGKYHNRGSGSKSTHVVSRIGARRKRSTWKTSRHEDTPVLVWREQESPKPSPEPALPPVSKRVETRFNWPEQNAAV